MKRIGVAIIMVFLLPSILNAKTINGYVEGIGCASDTQKGFKFAKMLAEAQHEAKAISKIFVMGDSLLDITFNHIGDEVYQVDPNSIRIIMRGWIKVFRNYYGTPAISVTLHESDGTTIAEGSNGIFSGKIKIEIY